jgi:hypothetical protein
LNSSGVSGNASATTSTLALALGRLDEQHVGAGLAIAPAALERRVQAFDGARVGAGDDHEVVRAARLDRGPHLLDHLICRDHVLARQMPAALRRHLVLEMERRHPGRLVLADCAHDVERVAVAVVGVGDHGDADGLHETAGVVDHLAERQQPDVGASQERRRGAVAGHVHGFEARLLDQPRRQRVVGAGRDDGVRACEQLAEASRAAVVLRDLWHTTGVPGKAARRSNGSGDGVITRSD